MLTSLLSWLFLFEAYLWAEMASVTLVLAFTIYHGEGERGFIDAHLVLAICIIGVLLALSLARHSNQGEHPLWFDISRWLWWGDKFYKLEARLFDSLAITWVLALHCG